MAGSNIIINYLPSDADEDEIKKIFEAFGKVISVRLIRNKETQASLCYGFVIMDNELESQVAIDALNQKTLRDKTLKVSRAKTKEEVAKGGDNTNIYIMGVNPKVDSDILTRCFCKFGPIVSTHIVKNRDPSLDGVAFVKFFEKEDAERAIQEQNNKVLCLRYCKDLCECKEVITCKFAIPSSAKFQKQILGQGRTGLPINLISALPPVNGALSQTTLPNYGYATGHLQTFINPSTINSYFAPAPAYQYSYPYQAYAAYQYPYMYSNTSSSQTTPVVSSAYNSISAYNQIPQYSATSYTPPTVYVPPVIQNNTTSTSIDHTNNLAIGTHCVFVYGLAQATTEEELQALFLPFGAISNCRLSYEITDGKRSCKGYGFVNYYSFNDAQLAIAGLNNYNYNGHVLQVRFKSSKGGKG